MMFRSAKALDRAKTHSTFKLAMASYEKTAENWYDGDVGSIDRRIAQVDKLLHHIRSIVSRLDFADSVPQLRAAQTLSADRKQLVELKRTLLTGAADYSTFKTAGPCMHEHEYEGNTFLCSYDEDEPHEHSDEKERTSAVDALPPSDRRWVTLESSRFVSANTDCLSDPEELATRAGHHVALKTSTFSRPHSAAVSRAFVGAVVELGKKTYRPPPVKQSVIYQDVPAETMFL
jgi:hypothetical protein